jgi:excisionase family DNA binding protein
MVADTSVAPADHDQRLAVSPARGYYSVSQVAALLGVNRVSVWRWIRAGQLPASRVGHRTTRIKHDDLEQALIRIRPAIQPGWLLREPAAVDEAKGQASEQSVESSPAPEHIAQFYESDAFLLDALRTFIGPALRDGEVGLVVATEGHRTALEARLQADGLDLAGTQASGCYVALDAAEILSRIMLDGQPDADRFESVIGGLVAQLAASGRPLRVFGEMVALLSAAGNLPGARRLEALWNDLHRTRPFALLCAYPLQQLDGESLGTLLDDVHAEHARVIPGESYAAQSSPDGRLRAILALQRKAAALQFEITERQQAEQALQALLEQNAGLLQETKEAVLLRDEFLSIASHELRTPLTTVAAHAQLMLRQLARDGTAEPARIERAFRSISEQTNKLSRLVEQLLDVSRLEAGRFALEPQRTDLRELVERVAAAAAVRAKQPIVVYAPETVRLLVDPLRLDQMLTNLLDNAIKYSAADQQIDVELARRSEGQVEVAVRDRGQGIPPDKRSGVFERYFQAHAEGHRSGMGLGLYISRQVAELHGGAIRVEYPPDGGTRFVVRLPVEREAPAAPTTDRQSRQAVPSGTGSRPDRSARFTGLSDLPVDVDPPSAGAQQRA